MNHSKATNFQARASLSMTSTHAAGAKPLPEWYYVLCPPEAQTVLTKSLEQWALQTAEGNAAALKGKDEALKGKDEALKIALEGKDDVLKGKDEALKGKDEALKGKDEALKGKDEALKIALEGKDDVLKGKDEALKIALEGKDEALKIALEGKDEALKIALEGNAAALNGKDEALKMATVALDQTQKALDGAEQRHLQEICRYRLTYQIRETFTWLLRCLMVDKLDTAPGNLYKDLFNMMTEKGQGPSASLKLTTDALDIYKQIQPHFKMGACTPTFIEALRGQFSLIHGNMHGGKTLELPGRTGLACGGESRDTMFMHAFIVLNIQTLCIKRRLPLPPELTALAVMTAEYNGIVGDCVNGTFVELEP